MTAKLLLLLHLLGSAVWIGGHVVLVRVILPRARASHDPAPVIEFERGYGKIGLAALVIQVATGVMLASPYIGGWGGLLGTPTPARPLVIAKLAILATILILAADATHRVLPRLRAETLGAFTVHAWIVTVLSVCLLVLGAGIRSGGLL